MGKKKIVSVEEILLMQEERAKINRIPLNEILFFENGKPLKIPDKIVEDFEFTGLNNIDFITSGAYKGQLGS